MSPTEDTTSVTCGHADPGIRTSDAGTGSSAALASTGPVSSGSDKETAFCCRTSGQADIRTTQVSDIFSNSEV